MADDTTLSASPGQVLRGPRYQGWMYVGCGILYVALGALLIGMGIIFGRHSSGLVWGLLAGAVFGVIGVVWIVRALHARVELTDDTLTLYGYLVTRRIPRSSIVGFGGNGSVEWGPNGMRTTLITVLGPVRPVTGSAGPFLKRFANDDLGRIQAWAAADHKLTQNW